MGKSSESSNRLVANNKKAYYDYFIEEKIEAGLVLHGTEVKSLRQGKCSIKESYIQIQNGEVFAINMNITPYEKGNIFNKDPLRPKKLLLHKNEISKLSGQIATKGYTLVPLQVYFKQGKVKIEIGLARGKKNYDKRESIAKRDQERQAQKELKNRNLRF
ncbi:MAG: SsrA-binding protein SmpB [Lachnospira sp.]|uniref:SsrA-binding protein n=1 Tax=Lachnospira pectinoschiza TaxID=28052 RepID=A0A1G9VYH9_9FIRM|nr:SsrA-binding protein SmpB [Lachnospira pectinoschiza]MCR5516625.1 SsrA-binding protein SmpB [Lachnospira sp.]SDM76976.1 SsrA-binding protein [Lachnospira pectinoschiza]